MVWWIACAAAVPDVTIRGAQPEEAPAVCEVLAAAFRPYRRFYTEEAYRATVGSPHEMESRIWGTDATVLVVRYDRIIVGTASLQREGDRLHIKSMAVRPACQGLGIGRRMMKDIQKRARRTGCATLSLECYCPLTSALHLYRACGFETTGRERDYHGIRIFEMQKRL